MDPFGFQLAGSLSGAFTAPPPVANWPDFASAKPFIGARLRLPGGLLSHGTILPLFARLKDWLSLAGWRKTLDEAQTFRVRPMASPVTGNDDDDVPHIEIAYQQIGSPPMITQITVSAIHVDARGTTRGGQSLALLKNATVGDGQDASFVLAADANTGLLVLAQLDAAGTVINHAIVTTFQRVPADLRMGVAARYGGVTLNGTANPAYVLDAEGNKVNGAAYYQCWNPLGSVGNYSPLAGTLGRMATPLFVGNSCGGHQLALFGQVNHVLGLSDGYAAGSLTQLPGYLTLTDGSNYLAVRAPADLADVTLAATDFA